MALSSRPSQLFQATLSFAQSLLFDPKYFWRLATLVIVGDALLTGLVILFVPYTEIDWETYMVHVKLYLQGEHNYSMITGPTGPLVYPAGHVRIHRILHDITNSGKNIQLAQCIYGCLYITSLFLSCAIYRSAGNIPNWIVLLLPLSKRLHSIFALRLFNDCWAVVAAQASILAFQNGFHDGGIWLFSAALSVKMSILLYLPGILVVLFKRKGLLQTLIHVLALFTTHIMFAVPFLLADYKAYLRASFDFGRVFLYKWTVNWRFFDEETFLSREFAVSLLIGHASVLIAFGLFKWCEPDGGVFLAISRGLKRPRVGSDTVTADYVATVLFTCNLIGILFARSLHYQFYSWYAQQIPFLAWRTRYPLPIKLLLIGGIEYAWNIFPSTPLSSGVLVASNALLLAGIWFGYPAGKRT